MIYQQKEAMVTDIITRTFNVGGVLIEEEIVQGGVPAFCPYCHPDDGKVVEMTAAKQDADRIHYICPEGHTAIGPTR